MDKYILALDQGTTSSRAILFDKSGKSVGLSQVEIEQIYPRPGWVEHDPMKIWGTQSGVARQVLEAKGIRPEQVAGIGVTNQRETTIVWDKKTGRPVYNAIVWQCRRTSDLCDYLREKGLEASIREKTGLILDAYFSATKLKWILDNVEGVRERAERGELLFGTVDTWIIWNLTRGKVHVTDYGNASRTMLYNINTLEWDSEILEILGIPKSMLPEVRSSSEVYGYTDVKTFGGAEIPIAGNAGDQQSSLFGQMCIEKGMVKSTYGTGCFMLMNTGEEIIRSKNGLLTTIAWGIGGKLCYALEGSVFNAGSAIQWLRDELRLIYDAKESEYYASMVEDTNGVYFVPAFTGLGAPHWDMYARGTIVGITRGVKREHIVRATLESIAYQVKDIIVAMGEDSLIDISEIRVDGGASENNFLMQFQADIVGNIPVIRSSTRETTALGVAYLAGLAVGYWKDLDQINSLWSNDRIFTCDMDQDTRVQRYGMWRRAIEKSSGWER